MLLCNCVLYAQDYNYKVDIIDYDYNFLANSGLCGENKHVRLTVTDVNNVTHTVIFTRDPKVEKRKILTKYFEHKPKQIQFSSFIHERSWFSCDGYSASVGKTDILSFNASNVASGFMDLYDSNGGQATIDVSFKYSAEKLKKAFNYKVEYNFDLSNKSKELFFPFDRYTGSYYLKLRSSLQSKRIYLDNVQITNFNDPEIIRNKKYDSIIRFISPMEFAEANSKINYKATSSFICDGAVQDENGFVKMDNTRKTVISEVSGCLKHNYLFPYCGSLSINYINIYRIYDDPRIYSSNSLEKDQKEAFDNRLLKDCQPLKFYVNDCNEESSYAVEYKLETNADWKTYLPYERRASFFELNTANISGATIGKSLKVRIKYYNEDCEKYSYLCNEPLSFGIISCSPEFLALYNQKNYFCSYQRADLDEGKVSVKLSRPIESTEQLVVTLFYVDGMNRKILVNQLSSIPINIADPIIQFDDLGGGNVGFEWPEKISPTKGTDDYYYFRYQTLNIGESPQKPVESSPFWDSLEKTDTFRLDQPTNISFSARHKKDQSCYGVNDGQIEIYNVNGGTGEGFEYELNGNGTWVPFSTSVNTARNVVIGSLPKGKSRIRVRDGNKCLAKKE